MKNILIFINSLSAFVFSSAVMAHEGPTHIHAISGYLSVVILSLLAGFLAYMIIKSFNNDSKINTLKGK